MIGSLAALVLIAAAQPSNQIEGLTVTAGPRPTVLSSYPASGASVPAGVMILKVVFDRPMKPDGWAYGPSAGVDLPSCLAQPRMLADQRTFVLLCTVAPDHQYAVEINPEPRFAGGNGSSAKRFILAFSTTDTEFDDLHGALLQAGLTDADDPIMTSRDAGKDGSQTEPRD